LLDLYRLSIQDYYQHCQFHRNHHYKSRFECHSHHLHCTFWQTNRQRQHTACTFDLMKRSSQHRTRCTCMTRRRRYRCRYKHYVRRSCTFCSWSQRSGMGSWGPNDRRFRSHPSRSLPPTLCSRTDDDGEERRGEERRGEKKRRKKRRGTSSKSGSERRKEEKKKRRKEEEKKRRRENNK